jgi:hypothetical protein
LLRDEVRGGLHAAIGGFVQSVVACQAGQRIEGEDLDRSVAAAAGSVEQGDESLL